MNLLSLIESLEAVGVSPDKILSALKESYARERESTRQRVIKHRKIKGHVTDVTQSALQDAPLIENTRAPDSLFLPSEVSKESKEVKKEKIIEKKERNGSRFALTQLPDNWKSFCLEKRPDLNPFELFDAFRDWWIAMPGSKGLKLDWTATWRNWVRNQKKENKNGKFRDSTGKGQQARHWAEEGLREMEESGFFGQNRPG